MKWQLAGFDSENFIQEYWQKKPCIIREAFVDIESPISPEELAGLACEEDVHSRLILEKGAETAWQLRYGPFSESDFTTLPDSNYSLLVSECEKWIPELGGLLEAFNFVPKWRIDDAMISYAPPGGSVGPHVDEYDVFLLQLQGKRRWQYDETRMSNSVLIPDLDLAILKSFDAEQEAILKPGDMLYLPPGVAHHGVAVDACLTCSIGFRAPTATETLDSFALEIDKQDLGKARYRDVSLETNRHSSEITRQEIERFRQLVLSLLDQPEALWTDAVGKLLSDTVINSDAQNQSIKTLDQMQGKDWAINPDTRMLYHADGSSIRFYYNGQCEVLHKNSDSELFVQNLCCTGEITPPMFESARTEVQLADLLIKMANINAVVLIEDE